MNVAALIRKLEAEQYETDDPGHSALELAARRGWNNRAKELIASLRIEAGLVELEQATPMDLRFKASLTGFDVSDQDGEG